MPAGEALSAGRLGRQGGNGGRSSAPDSSPRQDLFEVGDRLQQSVAQLDRRFPVAEHLVGEGDVGFALLRVVRRQGHADDFRFGAGEFEDDVRQLGDREFVRVADIDRPREVVGRDGHHAEHPFHKIVDILETAGLLAVAVGW